MTPFDPQRYLGLDDREFEEFRSPPPGRRWWQVVLWLAYVKRRWFGRALVWLIAGITGTTIVWTAFLSVLEPWNHSLYLWPTLSGSWYGHFEAPDGTQIVHLSIDGDSDPPPLEGTATTCDARGVLRTFDISGSPHGWRGKRFAITTSRSHEVDEDAIELARVDGEWAGDSMRVTAVLHQFTGARHASGSSAADSSRGDSVIQFALHRGNRREFGAACARLRRAQ
jgi:hypothetical protein